MRECDGVLVCREREGEGRQLARAHEALLTPCLLDVGLVLAQALHVSLPERTPGGIARLVVPLELDMIHDLLVVVDVKENPGVRSSCCRSATLASAARRWPCQACRGSAVHEVLDMPGPKVAREHCRCGGIPPSRHRLPTRLADLLEGGVHFFALTRVARGVTAGRWPCTSAGASRSSSGANP